jgi:glycosyltransferase involved in cell wall biosynthesis
MKQTKRQRRRTLADLLISGFNSIRFKIIEPLELVISRIRYGNAYNDEKEPLVSVRINTFNRGKLLVERAVASVLSQTYKNLELVIVGNHCTDDTEKLLSKITDSRLRFYNLPFRKFKHPDNIEIHWLMGGIYAYNKNLDMIRGKWTCWLGDDDTWTPDFIETMLQFAQNGNYEFVSAQYIEERYGKRTIVDGERAEGFYYTRRQNKNDKSPKIGGIQTWLHRSYLRSFKLNENCWRKSWNRPVDADISLRFYNSGVRMGFLPKVVAYVLPRPGEETIGLDAYKKKESEYLSELNKQDAI